MRQLFKKNGLATVLLTVAGFATNVHAQWLPTFKYGTVKNRLPKAWRLILVIFFLASGTSDMLAQCGYLGGRFRALQWLPGGCNLPAQGYKSCFGAGTQYIEIRKITSSSFKILIRSGLPSDNNQGTRIRVKVSTCGKKIGEYTYNVCYNFYVNEAYFLADQLGPNQYYLVEVWIDRWLYQPACYPPSLPTSYTYLQVKTLPYGSVSIAGRTASESSIFIDDSQIKVDSLGYDQIGESDDNVMVYPNPSSDIVNVEIPYGETFEHAELLPVRGGDPISKSTKLPIDVSQLPQGYYILRIKTNIRQTSISILVNH